MSSTEEVFGREYSYKEKETKWGSLRAEFPTEQACFEELCRRSGISTNSCGVCPSTNVRRLTNFRVLKCNECKEETWITSGSWLHKVRKFAPRLGFALQLEAGVAINANELSKLSMTAYSSALKMHSKMRIAIDSQLKDQISAPSSALKPACRKRSLFTPRKEPPWKEEDAMREESQLNLSPPAQGSEDQATLEHPALAKYSSEQDRAIYDELTDEPRLMEHLPAKLKLSYSVVFGTLDMMAIDNLVEGKADRYKKLKFEAPKDATAEDISAEAAPVIELVKLQIIKENTGVSRRRLQWYIAPLWIRHRVARGESVDIVEACVKYGRVGKLEYQNFNTPLVVRLFSIAA